MQIDFSMIIIKYLILDYLFDLWMSQHSQIVIRADGNILFSTGELLGEWEVISIEYTLEHSIRVNLIMEKVFVW